MLDVVSRLQLSVPHGIFFHPHEGGIRVGLGITVPVPAHLQLSVSDAVNEKDPFLPLDLDQLIPQLDEGIRGDGILLNDPDTVV